MHKIEQQIKLTHLPTGTVVVEDKDRSLFRNREKAFARLKKLVPDYKMKDVLIERFTFA